MIPQRAPQASRRRTGRSRRRRWPPSRPTHTPRSGWRGSRCGRCSRKSHLLVRALSLSLSPSPSLSSSLSPSTSRSPSRSPSMSRFFCFCLVLSCSSLRCSLLRCTALHCTALHCTEPNRIAPRCTVSGRLSHPVGRPAAEPAGLLHGGRDAEVVIREVEKHMVQADYNVCMIYMM